jgi:serine/threonine protein phosphatase 1
MSITYAVPDLHGRLDLLDSAIEAIVEHAKGKPSTVVTLGDYVDRGPNSREVIDRLIDWSVHSLTLVCLKGNHEEMMWGTCSNLTELHWWTKNGGDQTLASYGQLNPDQPDLSSIPRAHLDWIAGLRLLHVDQHRVFVHAAVDPKVSLHQQNERTLLWKRYPTNFKAGHGQRHVVHGHDGTVSAPVVFAGKTNLDGLAWKTGRLVIGVFDDNCPGAAQDFLEIVGKPHSSPVSAIQY